MPMMSDSGIPSRHMPSQMTIAALRECVYCATSCWRSSEITAPSPSAPSARAAPRAVASPSAAPLCACAGSGVIASSSVLRSERAGVSTPGAGDASLASLGRSLGGDLLGST